MSVSVVFETHSTSVDNERGVATGWNEGELSDPGSITLPGGVPLATLAEAPFVWREGWEYTLSSEGGAHHGA